MSEEKIFEFDEIINAGDKFYLNEIITDDLYDKWFARTKPAKIFVLNKGRCGNGGTTGFINYAKRKFKGLHIIVPNRSIVKSKEVDEDLCCVYGGAEGYNTNANIRVSTWDKHKTVDEFLKFGMDMNGRWWSGSLLVVDEYHKLVEDSNYRPICGKIVKSIIEAENNVVLMSATPDEEFIEFLRDASGKEVETYNVKYGEDIQIPIQWMERNKKQKLFDVVNEVMRTAREKAECGAVHQVLFFYNSVEGINNIVNKLKDEDKLEVEHLCSKDSKDKALLYSEEFNTDKKFHFLTSAHLVGMDVYSYIDKVIFIGGNNSVSMPLSRKEVKQGLGRPRKTYWGHIIPDEKEEMDEDLKEAMKCVRKTYGSSFVIHNGMSMDKKRYALLAGEKADAEEYINEVKEVNSVKLKKNDRYIEAYLTYLYCKNKMESMNGWNDGESFKKMMSAYPEYTVEIHKMKEPGSFKRREDISFKEYKEKRLAGEKVSYRYSAICEKFIELRGIECFKNAKRNEIDRYVKLNGKVGDVCIESLSGREKYDLLLSNGFYKGSFLMDVLKFIGYNCEYDRLEETMNEAFGCFCVYDSGNTAKKRSCLYLCVMVDNGWKMSNIGDKHSIRRDKIMSPILDKNHQYPIKVSKKISKRNKTTEAITDYLDITQLYSMINDGDENQSEFFTVLLKDPSLITETKQDQKWKKYFDYCKMNQTMISEFYKDTSSKSVKYPHKKEEMEKIDCLIVDIDDSISFNEFKEIYSDYEWTAYPTLSNTDGDNWNKFRVILPLAHTLSIPNDSLNVLKMLRRMVCKYEDKNHQLGSYVNQEQWEMRRVNEGMAVDISQGKITYLNTLIKSLKTFEGKFKKVKKDGGFSTSNYWDMERAIAYYQERDKDGERHNATFVIKNRLSEEDCKEFEKWFASNHYDKMHHWKSHKRIAS